MPVLSSVQRQWLKEHPGSYVVKTLSSGQAIVFDPAHKSYFQLKRDGTIRPTHRWKPLTEF